MGLSEQQHVLARLLTDANLRARFVADSEAVAHELAFSPDDAAQLSALIMPDVWRSARSLYAKRWNEVEKLLPLSVCAAHQADVPLRRWFAQFSQTYVPKGDKRHAQDAIAFSDWYAQPAGPTLSEAEGALKTDAWLADLMRYEAAWLAVSLDTRSRFVVLRRFRFPVHRIAWAMDQAAQEPFTSNAVIARSSLAVWWRLSADSRVRHFILP